MMRALHPIVQMLGSIVGPTIEVVLHDLSEPARSIVALVNGHVSNRTVGGSILSGPKDDKGFHEAMRQLTVGGRGEHSVISGYPTTTSSGLRLKSSTVIFRDSLGQPYAALCLNSDLTMFHATHAWLGSYLTAEARPVRADAPQPAMDTLMQEIIDDAVRRFGKPVEMMKKDEKTQAVQAMLQRGLFIVKGGVERAAKALGVSRYTVYNYMDALRQRGDAAQSTLHRDSTHTPAKKKSTDVRRRAAKRTSHSAGAG